MFCLYIPFCFWNMFENSDDYDFSPAESSKLASLFGTSALSSDSLNSSLKYTAPKQPTPSNSKKNEPLKSTPKPQTTVVLAKVVLLWKLEDEDYKVLGKHGLAIIGSEDLKIYEIIAYKEKTNVILKTNVSSDFQFHIQKDNFSSFYDTNSQNWLIKFENEDQKEFGKVIEKCGAKVVFNVEQTSEKNTESAKPDLLPKPKLDSEITAEDQNSDSSGSLKRSNILNRMAKMGQQILPRHSVRNTSTDISDTELEEKRIERKFTRKLKHTVSAEKKLPDVEKQVVPASSSSVDFIPSTNPIIFASSAQAVNSDIFSHYIVSQNTELKMHLTQMSAKLDSVLMGHNNNATAQDPMAQSKIKALQLKLENLEAYLKDYEKKYLQLEMKNKELSRNESDKNLIEKLEKELLTSKSRLIELEKQLEDFEGTKKSLEHCKSCIEVKERLIEVQKMQLQTFKEQNQQATIDSLNETVDELRNKLKEYEDKAVIEKQNTEVGVAHFSNAVKTNMNEMYVSILENLDSEKTYSYSEVQSTIAKYLKTTTFKIIDDLNDIDKTDVILSPTNFKPEV